MRADSALLDDQAVPFQFYGLPLDDLLLDGVLGDHAVDVDAVALPDAVGAVHGLQVHLGVPVRVVDDDGVGRGEVYSQAAGTRG